MDLQSFIQSGLLEAYVAGHCDAAERQEVERMAAQHPEVRAELARIEQALEKIAIANAVEPPPGLKKRILDQLEQNDERLETPDAELSPVPKAARSSLRLYQVLTVVLAALASFFFWQWMFVSADNEKLKSRTDSLQAQYDDCAKRREHSEPMAVLLRDTDTRQVKLSDGKNYHITIFNNKLRKECALDITGLPLPTAGKYFQAWAIIEGKPPISLGMVEMNALAGWQPLPYIENAKTYAISEEKSPQGNHSPTYVIAFGDIDAG